MTRKLLLSFVAAIFTTFTMSAQIVEIDRAKLPSEASVQSAYDDLLPIDQFARTYEATWRFPLPKNQVADRFTRSLHILEKAQADTPSNRELELLTGLVAHLAYNLDVEEAYDPAMKFLGALSASDFRAAWFLGVHQCESNDNVGGMERLLSVEQSTTKLPAAFWIDYANCAGVSFMPVHAVRAYDRADALNGGMQSDPQLEAIARNRVKPSSDSAVYTNKQAWVAIQTGKRVKFISSLCGVSFETDADVSLDIADVKDGTCSFVIDGKPYPTRDGTSGASFAVMSKPSRPGETISSFAHGFLTKPAYASARTITGLPCPSEPCVAYEVITDKLYSKQGGAHLLALFFASEPPIYPGLRFETPASLPKPSDSSSGPSFYRPDETLQRLPGTRYFVAILDSNADIYLHSRADFDALLHTLILDSK